jgi:quinol monooxygenase YgiN
MSSVTRGGSVVVMTGRIEAKPGGRRELTQALLEWLVAARGTDGADTQLYEDVECAHVFCFVSHWPSLESLERHVRGQSFGGLVGAIELLASTGMVTLVTGQGGRRGFRDLRRRVLAASAEATGTADEREA